MHRVKYPLRAPSLYWYSLLSALLAHILHLSHALLSSLLLLPVAAWQSPDPGWASRREALGKPRCSLMTRLLSALKRRVQVRKMPWTGDSRVCHLSNGLLCSLTCNKKFTLVYRDSRKKRKKFKVPPLACKACFVGGVVTAQGSGFKLSLWVQSDVSSEKA